jgi:cystathionine beta-lyase
VTIISDEIHADLEMPGHKVTSIAALEPHSVVLVSATKTFNLAAVRMSSVIIRDADMRQKYVDEYAARGVEGVNVFGRIAQRAAYEGGEEWLDALLSYLAGTRDMVEAFLKAEIPQVTCAPLEGTYLMWLDFRAFGLAPDEMAKLLVNEARVALNPGTDYGERGAGWFRLNLATPRRNLVELLDRLENALRGR